MISVDEVKTLAMENYAGGGYVVVECYEDSEIAEAITKGNFTAEDWLESFRRFDKVMNEIRKI